MTYSEKESKVLLGPWSRLTRDTMTLNAGPAVVTLDHGQIKLVEQNRRTVPISVRGAIWNTRRIISASISTTTIRSRRLLE